MYMPGRLKGGLITCLRTPCFELFAVVLPIQICKLTDIKTKIGEFIVFLGEYLLSQDESLDVLEIVSKLSERVVTCRSEFFLSIISIFFKNKSHTTHLQTLSMGFP